MVFVRMVRITVLASMTMALSAAAQSPRVVVVGAGIAGLTTAYRLQQKGIDVQVYEARGRVGGRILSAMIGGMPIELGGHNLTDGGAAENVYQLISELGLDLVTRSMPLNESYFDGKNLVSLRHLLNAKKFDPLTLQIQLTDLAMNALNMREVLDGVLPKDDILNGILATRLAAYEGAPVEQLSPWYTETLYHMLLGGLAATRPADDNMTQHVTVSGGNSLLLQKMAQALGDRVHLNSALTAVVTNSDKSMTLTFNSSTQVVADIVVLAIPCSLFGGITFDAATLPADRVQAISQVSYTTNAKVLIPFSPSLISSSGDVVGESMVSVVDAQHGLVTTYLTGMQGLFTPETIHDVYTTIRPLISTALVDVCPPVAEPVYAQDKQGVSYTGPVGYSWVNDPWVRGSYSYVAAGQEMVFAMVTEVAGEPVKALFTPVHNKVYFAGEHASVLMDVTGTIEAACESGERTARMIVKAVL
ncbi:MAG: monoamine oxidase [Candidatus Dependentiae bacterium]|nr:monoamine oxidase [Candidatus Dependentiae bacterium]